MSDQKNEHNHKKELIWNVAKEEAAALVCRACGTQLQPDDEAVSCPRCKGVHHLSCWVEKSGCSTHGCSQLADPSFTADKSRRYEPPAKNGGSWLPIAITALLLVLVISSALWVWLKDPSAPSAITVMVPVGPDLEAIQQAARKFDEAHDELSVEVLSIPDGPNGMYYEEKLVIMLASREAPDIIILPYDRFTEYVKLGALKELNSIRTSLKAVPYGNRINNGVVAGNLYGAPHPSQAGLFAVPNHAPYAEQAQRLLLSLVKALPFKPGINDKAVTTTMP